MLIQLKNKDERDLWDCVATSYLYGAAGTGASASFAIEAADQVIEARRMRTQDMHA